MASKLLLLLLLLLPLAAKSQGFQLNDPVFLASLKPAAAAAGSSEWPAGYFIRLTNGTAGANGDAVSTWVDVSGNGNDATQAGDARPFLTNGVFTGSLPGLQFDGVNDKMVTASIAHGIGTGDFTIAAKVIPLDATGTYKGCVAIGAFAPACYLRLGTAPWGLYLGGDLPSDNTLAADTKYWLVIRRAGTTLTFWQNGVAAGSDTSNTSIGNAAIAVGDDGSGAFAKQIIGEVVAYTSALTDGQITAATSAP